MILAPELRRQLSCMEEARRQTQRQLNQLDRQITRRMTALIPGLLPRRTPYRRGKAPDPGAFLASYRAQLAALTAERQPEIDALSRKLARQEQAIARFLDFHGAATEIASGYSDTAPGRDNRPVDDVAGRAGSRRPPW
jgi:hypothetical protein